jgi:hypothetical protein
VTEPKDLSWIYGGVELYIEERFFDESPGLD